MATERSPREQRLILQRYKLAESGLLHNGEPFLVLSDHENRTVAKITVDADTGVAILWHHHSYVVEYEKETDNDG